MEESTTDAYAADRLDEDLAEVDRRLAQRYPEVPAAAVRRLREEEAGRLADARVTTFVPVLVERAVRDRIEHDTVS